MKIKKPAMPKLRPRNPTVQHVLFRKAGAHRQSEKALRKQLNDELRSKSSSKEDFSLGGAIKLLAFI